MNVRLYVPAKIARLQSHQWREVVFSLSFARLSHDKLLENQPNL